MMKQFFRTLNNLTRKIFTPKFRNFANLLLVILPLTTFKLTAQIAPVIQWANNKNFNNGEDWNMRAMNTSDGSYLMGGYVEIANRYGNGIDFLIPGLIKMNKNGDELWRYQSQFYMDGSDTIDPFNFVNKMIEVSDGYIFVSQALLKSEKFAKICVTKIAKDDGSLVSGFPIVLNDGDDSARLRWPDIIALNSGDFIITCASSTYGTAYQGGAANTGKVGIYAFKLNSSFSVTDNHFLSYYYFDTQHNSGDYYQKFAETNCLCKTYLYGTNPDGTPVSGGAETGFAVFASLDKNIEILKCDNNLTVRDTKVINSDDYTGTPWFIPTYDSDAPFVLTDVNNTIVTGNSNDQPFNIIQTSTGEILIASLFNKNGMTFLDGNDNPLDPAYNYIYSHAGSRTSPSRSLDYDYLVQGQVVLIRVGIHVVSSQFVFETTPYIKYVDHSSGGDDWPCVRENYDGDFIVSAGEADIGNLGGTLLDDQIQQNLKIFKLSSNLSTESYRKGYPSSIGDEGACNFDHIITPDNGILIVGDVMGTTEKDNFNELKLGNDCVLNIVSSVGADDIAHNIDVSNTWPFTLSGGVYTITGLTVKVSGQINIPSGHDVLIENSTLEFASATDIRDFDDPNQFIGIRVQSGNTITISGSTLTSIGSCNSLWDGIIVNGDAGIGQGSTQTKLIITNYYNTGTSTNRISRIENAILGASLLSGAILIADNGSTFTNCRSSIFFGAYSINSGSSIKNCIFECTAPINTYYKKGPYAFIGINNIQGILVGGSTFQNTVTAGSFCDDNRGIGIYAVDSRFKAIKAKSSCDGTGDGNTFLNLTYGILHEGSDEVQRRVDIWDNTFENCQTSIKLENTLRSNVYNNDISFYTNYCDAVPRLNGSNPTACSGYKGIYMKNSSDFILDHNSITLRNGNDAVENDAIIIDNSYGDGTSFSFIYGNTIEGKGQYSRGATTEGYVGCKLLNNNDKLKILGNIFGKDLGGGAYTDFDFGIWQSATGTLGDQNYTDGGIIYAADNEFNGFTTVTPTKIYSVTNPIEYFFSPNTNTPPTPLYVSSGDVNSRVNLNSPGIPLNGAFDSDPEDNYYCVENGKGAFELGDPGSIFDNWLRLPINNNILNEAAGIQRVKERLEIMPNPANNMAQINFTLSNANDFVCLYNMHGQLINKYDTTSKRGSIKLFTEELPDGIYFIHAGTQTAKLTLTH